jgi:hypothetical protein
MRATARRTAGVFCCGLAAGILWGDASSEARDLLRDAAGAMAEGNAHRFLGYVDPGLPGYARLSRDVAALIEQYEVTSAIEPVGEEGDERSRTLELDWYLQIRTRDLTGVLERRRQTVRCRVAKNGKRWRITELDPLEFFAPPKL